MIEASRLAWRRSVPWLVLGILAIGVLGLRLQLSFDLSAFFPQKTSLMHDVLLEQFRNGPGSRLLVVGINGAPREELEELSHSLSESLADEPQFASVLNGSVSEDSTPPEPINRYYLLMRDVDYSQASLQQAIHNRLQDLAFGGGAALLDLIARDPFLVTLDILESLTPVDLSGDLWMADDGSAVLIAETHATAVDIAGQADAVQAIRSAFSALATDQSISLEITGAGAFGVELQQTIRAEAQKRSLLATAALLIILFVFYRRPRHLLLATVPIGMGFLVGLATVSLIFDSVHGITLAFGFTLMGVAIDYPLHLFSHTRNRSDANPIKRIWPTMRLGAASTAVAYLALALSGSDGLAQLGVFTATGILIAVLVTRTWLPYLLGNTATIADTGKGREQSAALSYLPSLIALGSVALAASFVVHNGLWDDKLTSLSPVPQERLRTDIALRSATGAPDMRHQIVLYDDQLQTLLEQNEAVDVELAEAARNGLLTSWQSVTQVLPSDATQGTRRVAVPDEATMRERINEAISDTPYSRDAFDSFAQQAEGARTLRLLSVSDIQDSPLKSWLGAHLVKVRDQWVSLISLNDPNPAELRKLVPTWGEKVSVMDLQQASVDLMRYYRNGALTTVSFAAFIILVLLWYQRRRLLQIAWIALTDSASLAVTIIVVASLHQQLTVIHLVALLLVLGLGLDYALFLSRTETPAERQATNHAVLACAVSTTMAFGILATSSIPVLKFLGLTVALGSAFSYLLAVAGSRLSGRAATS